MEYVAHRGYAEEYPENTLAAFREAGDSADWIEFDVRRCGSGELVVFHDETLGRVTGDGRSVGCTPWRALRKLDVLGSGERIPRLEDALEAIEDHDNPAILISFSLLALQEAREEDAAVPLGYVLHDGVYGDAPELGVDTAAHVGCEAVHMYYATGSDPAVVEYAHDRGLVVQTAVPEAGPTEQVLETCRTVGVDRLSTDVRPDR